MVEGNRPAPSVPSTIANRSHSASRRSPSASDRSSSANAATLNPAVCSSGTPSTAHWRCVPMRVHGTCSTVPWLARLARRNSGSWHEGVTSTASMPNACAARNALPMLA